jgi:hypothetical protein
MQKDREIKSREQLTSGVQKIGLGNPSLAVFAKILPNGWRGIAGYYTRLRHIDFDPSQKSSSL